MPQSPFILSNQLFKEVLIRNSANQKLNMLLIFCNIVPVKKCPPTIVARQGWKTSVLTEE